jgi:hypothetical protein
MGHFRKTWRHEVIIEANSAEEAKVKWEELNLGNLDQEVKDKSAFSHDFIENVSFEDEEYNDII